MECIIPHKPPLPINKGGIWRLSKGDKGKKLANPRSDREEGSDKEADEERDHGGERQYSQRPPSFACRF